MAAGVRRIWPRNAARTFWVRIGECWLLKWSSSSISRVEQPCRQRQQKRPRWTQIPFRRTIEHLLSVFTCVQESGPFPCCFFPTFSWLLIQCFLALTDVHSLSILFMKNHFSQGYPSVAPQYISHFPYAFYLPANSRIHKEESPCSQLSSDWPA